MNSLERDQRKLERVHRMKDRVRRMQIENSRDLMLGRPRNWRRCKRLRRIAAQARRIMEIRKIRFNALVAAGKWPRP